MEVKRKYPAHSKRPAAPGVATLLPFNSSAATAHPSPTPRRLSRRLDRKSTRLNSRSLRHLVCRLLLEKKKKKCERNVTEEYRMPGCYVRNEVNYIVTVVDGSGCVSIDRCSDELDDVIHVVCYDYTGV